jgi:acyl-CoA thioesterase FadM
VEGFPFVHYETARFSDLDGMGHVNNAVFSVCVEQARLAWFGLHAADEPTPLQDVILARTEIDFRSQVSFGETVAIGVRPSRIGTKSFEFEFELRVGDRLVAEAKSIPSSAGSVLGVTPDRLSGLAVLARGGRTRSCGERRASPSRRRARGCLRRSPRSSSRRIRFWTRRVEWFQSVQRRLGAWVGASGAVVGVVARVASYRPKSEVETQIRQATARVGRGQIRVEVLGARRWGRPELHVCVRRVDDDPDVAVERLRLGTGTGRRT